MKKALHDALGYLWVKNSLEADKKRKQEIASEDARLGWGIDGRREFLFSAKWWGTTELGYINTWISKVPDEVQWFPKDQFIAYFKKQLNLSKTGGIWWNPKWGNMEDYFTEEEMKTLRVSVRNILGKEDARFSAHVPWEQREKYAEEMIHGIVPRTEPIRKWKGL
ncbi:MAG: hypothetical protein SOX38_14120 [Candidatus Limiplasma sp.]|nr:hypothetical protein [Candidatus Limiplasma sp.]